MGLSCARASGAAERVPSPELASTPLIELRLAHASPAPGRTAADFEGTTLYLEPNVVLSDSGIAHVHVDPAGNDAGQNAVILNLDLEPWAAARLHAATSEAIGVRMALILGSAIRSAPVIRSPIGAHPSASVQVRVEAPGHVLHRIQERWPQR